MDTLAILQNESSLTTLGLANAHLLLGFIPRTDIEFQLSHGRISILNEDSIWAEGTSKSSISLKIDYNCLFTNAQIFLTGMSSGTNLRIELKSASQTLGMADLKIESKWASNAVSIKLSNFIEASNLSIKLSNIGKNSALVKNVGIQFKTILSHAIVKSFVSKLGIKTIIVDSEDNERICARYYKTVNINKEKILPAEQNTSPLTSILTATYNGGKFLSRCAEQLFKTKKSFEWIVLDDWSSDGSDMLISKFPCKYIKPPSPVRNFSKANNRMAKEAKGKYLVFLNNDCYVEDEWLENMVARAEADPSIGAIGSLLLYPRTQLIQHAGVVFIPYEGGPLPGHLFHKQNMTEYKEFLKPRLFQAVTAASMLVPKKIFDLVGGFDENYIFGYEDVDLCLKIKKLGYKILFEPKSLAYHEEGGTLDDPSKTEFKKQLFENNKKVFQKKWTADIDHDFVMQNRDVNTYAEDINPSIVYIPITRGEGHDIYRVDNMVSGLGGCQILDWNNPQWPPQTDIILFHRFDMRQIDFFNETKKRYPDAVFGYDIDDYIFDLNVATDANLDKNTANLSSSYEEFMRKFDFYISPTDFLSNRISEKFNKPSFVVPNGVSFPSLRKNKTSQRIVLGYASGTSTHDSDFNLILPVLNNIVKKYSHVVVRLFGYINANLRSEKLKFVPFSEFPKYLNEFDINLAPLISNDFNNAKSSLKYIEAGILGIPTVASNTAGYREAIENGKTGFLCSNLDEWTNSLVMLIENEKLRSQIGENAKNDISRRFTVKAVGDVLMRVIKGMARPKYRCS